MTGHLPRVARLLALVCLLLLGAQGAPWGQRKAAASLARSPHVGVPRITCSLDDLPYALRGQELSFTVTVVDPDADRVAVRLARPIEGLYFPPAVKVRSGSPIAGRFQLRNTLGLQRIVFQACDVRDPIRKTEHVVELLVLGQASSSRRSAIRQSPGLLVGDVTGDGLDDVLGGGYSVDQFGNNAGAMYLWRGGGAISTSPTAILRATDPVPGDKLGKGGGNARQLADVNGDGLLDLVVSCPSKNTGAIADHGAILVWFGGDGFGRQGKPDATLAHLEPGAKVGALVGPFSQTSGQGVLLVDLDGDGIRDVLAGSTRVPVNGQPNTGALFFWKGGAELRGDAVAPTAILRASAAPLPYSLGTASGQGILVADVTGDGITDVVVGSSYAAEGAGAIYVWKGGSGLQGAVEPVAALTVSGGAGLGDADTSQGFHLLDVTGDGIRDVVGVDRHATVGGVVDAGAVHVWAGGPALAGTPPPSATLTRPDPSVRDYLGGSDWDSVRLLEVSGDRYPDLLVKAPNATVAGEYAAGAVFVWRAGPNLSGTPAPMATLTVPGGKAFDEIGNGGPLPSSFHGSPTGDVTGDGVPDVIVRAPAADVSGFEDNGALYVWAGGWSLRGDVAPTASLLGRPQDDEDLGAGSWRVVVQDVSGDGVDDIVVNNARADLGSSWNAGTIDVWLGGATLSGTPARWFEFTGQGSPGAKRPGGVDVVDLTGDGLPDLVWTEQTFASGFPQAIVTYAGGADLATRSGPSVVYRNPDPAAQAATLTLELFHDQDEDGHLDVIATSFNHPSPLNGQSFVGAAYVFRGGPGVSGLVSPLRTVVNATATYQESMGKSGVVVGEVTGRGPSEILFPTPDAFSGSLQGAGALMLWPGASQGTLLAPLRLQHDQPAANDRLGE